MMNDICKCCGQSIHPTPIWQDPVVMDEIAKNGFIAVYVTPQESQDD